MQPHAAPPHLNPSPETAPRFTLLVPLHFLAPPPGPTLQLGPTPGHTSTQAKTILLSALGDFLEPGYGGTTGPWFQKLLGPNAPQALERLGALSPGEKMD